MEILLSVVLGELTSRSIDFVVRKCSKPSAPELEDRLCRALLRAQVIVDEAMGRHITNQAMLHRLNMLRDGMYRGYYTLDAFRHQPHKVEVEATKDKTVSQTSFLSKVSSVKGLHSSNRATEILEQLQKVLHSLSSMIDDSEEMVVFLMSYPRLYRQPYSMHIQVGNCMFGRQLETELVINFLLQSWPHGSEELEVLPIFGPGRVGKSTLVAHVCKDERVRGHFSNILFLKGHDFTDDDLATLREGCAVEMEHQSRVPNTNKDGRLLLVVELVGDLDDNTWNKLYFASKRWMPSNSKIIVTCRSDKIRKFGTTEALSLQNLPHETFWYFFKTLSFGSTDPAEMHTSFVLVAMEIAKMLSGCLIGANITAYLLRDNFDIHFWCKVLAFLRRVTQHVSITSEHPFDLISENRLAHLGRMAAPSEDLVLYRQSQRSPQEEVPNVRIQDVMYGSVKPCGRFEVLAWRSPIPPYYSYVNTCEIRDLKGTATKRKRSRKN